MTTRRPRSFRRTMGLAAARAVIITAGLGSGMAFAATVEAPAPAPAIETPAAVAPAVPAGCWQGEAPADVVVPGHVVIRYDGEAEPRMRGERAVGEALATIFDGADHGVAEVIAFCR